MPKNQDRLTKMTNPFKIFLTFRFILKPSTENYFFAHSCYRNQTKERFYKICNFDQFTIFWQWLTYSDYHLYCSYRSYQLAKNSRCSLELYSNDKKVSPSQLSSLQLLALIKEHPKTPNLFLKLLLLHLQPQFPHGESLSIKPLIQWNS